MDGGSGLEGYLAHTLGRCWHRIGIAKWDIYLYKSTYIFCKSARLVVGLLISGLKCRSLPSWPCPASQRSIHRVVSLSVLNPIIVPSSHPFNHPPTASTTNLKLSLVLDSLPVFPVQPDDMSMLRPVVNLLQKQGDGAFLALRFALHLVTSQPALALFSVPMDCVSAYLVVVCVPHPAGQLVLEGAVAGEVAVDVEELGDVWCDVVTGKRCPR